MKKNYHINRVAGLVGSSVSVQSFLGTLRLIKLCKFFWLRPWLCLFELLLTSLGVYHLLLPPIWFSPYASVGFRGFPYEGSKLRKIVSHTQSIPDLRAIFSRSINPILLNPSTTSSSFSLDKSSRTFFKEETHPSFSILFPFILTADWIPIINSSSKIARCFHTWIKLYSTSNSSTSLSMNFSASFPSTNLSANRSKVAGSRYSKYFL